MSSCHNCIGAAAGRPPAGVHHHPTPVADIRLFKYDDYGCG